MRYLIFISIFITSCNNISLKQSPTSISEPIGLRIRIETFKNADIKNNPVSIGYGYRIFINDSLRVEQPNIPAAPGNNGFATEADAFKTASLVKEKIELGIMPPTITLTELDSMMVKY
ncbi:MAG: DUF4907 domain-containing protein [Bacteroidetes bacterium]|nr:DUF4907 domain-containing protein [Bacteroidota bacterium]